MCILSRKTILSIICILAIIIIILIWLVIIYNSQDVQHIRKRELMILTNCQEKDTNHKKFPRIIHRAFGFWDSSLPAPWNVSLKSCAESKNKFKIIIWNKTSTIKFLQREYPWFVQEFLAYRYPVQQADAARYFILHHYGGTYLDMDMKCTNRSSLSLFYNQFKSQESGLDTVLLPTDPTGVTNSFVLSKQCSKFMAYSIARLSQANRWYIIPYVTVIFSTGPMFLTSRYAEFTKAETHNVETVHVIKRYQFWDNYFLVSGKQGTWHDWDANILLSIYNTFTLTNLFILILLILITLWAVLKCGYCRSNKNHSDKHSDSTVVVQLLPKK